VTHIEQLLKGVFETMEKSSKELDSSKTKPFT